MSIKVLIVDDHEVVRFSLSVTRMGLEPMGSVEVMHC